MSESDFDYGKFLTLTGEIEKYLGYLKGNEQVVEWWQSYRQSIQDAGRPTVNQGPGYVSTPPDMDLWVDFYLIGLPGDIPDSELRPLAERCYEALDQSWKNGVTWADGIGQYLRDLCADIVRVDAGLLRESVQSFSDTRVALEGALPVDWTDLDFNSWTGLSSDDCQDFVAEFHSFVHDQYLTYFAHAETLFAGAGALVTSTQQGLVPMLESVRDGIKAQLVAWAERGHTPHDWSGPHPLVPKVFKAAGDIIDLIPVVGDIKGKGEKAAKATGSILDIFGAKPEFEPYQPFDAKSAEDIYKDMMAMLQDKYLRPLEQGMQKIKSERSQPIHAAQNGINPWFVETLAGLDKEPWEHEAEA